MSATVLESSGADPRLTARAVWEPAGSGRIDPSLPPERLSSFDRALDGLAGPEALRARGGPGLLDLRGDRPGFPADPAERPRRVDSRRERGHEVDPSASMPILAFRVRAGETESTRSDASPGGKGTPARDDVSGGRPASRGSGETAGPRRVDAGSGPRGGEGGSTAGSGPRAGDPGTQAGAAGDPAARHGGPAPRGTIPATVMPAVVPEALTPAASDTSATNGLPGSSSARSVLEATRCDARTEGAAGLDAGPAEGHSSNAPSPSHSVATPGTADRQSGGAGSTLGANVPPGHLPGLSSGAVAGTPVAGDPAPAIPVASLEELPAVFTRAVRLTLGAGGREALIRLDPPELGEIRILLQVDGERVQAQIMAERAEVRSWLRDSSDELKFDLKQSGLLLERLEIAARPLAGRDGLHVLPGTRAQHADGGERPDRPAGGAGGGVQSEAHSGSRRDLPGGDLGGPGSSWGRDPDGRPATSAWTGAGAGIPAAWTAEGFGLGGVDVRV